MIGLDKSTFKMNLMGSTALCLFLLFLIQHVCGQSGPVVQTPYGAVHGAYNYTFWEHRIFSSFRRIPFAIPPVGSLRFQPPLPVQPWNGTLDATQEAPACPQYDNMAKNLYGDEDCLYINVYTPVTNFSEPQPLKPVMLWIYGGGFTTGDGSDHTYGPGLLLEDDVVVVTFNYRVGAFGFLSLNHPRALGNMGLKDQYLAMQWVNKSIASFGGDPNQVTLFGESAGSVSVGYHVLSNRAKGLFSNAILMSGTPLCPWGYYTPEDAYENAYLLTLLLGHIPLGTDDMLRFLSEQPALAIANATTTLYVLRPVPFRPTKENILLDYNNTAYITECPLENYQNGNFNKVNTILGYTHDEALFFLYHIGRLANSSNPFNQLESLVAQDSQLLAAYNTSDNSAQDAVVALSVKIASDILFIGPIDKTQRLLVQNNDGKPIYYYRQSYESPYSWHRYFLGVPYDGVAHFDDIPYIWQTDEIPVPTNSSDPYYQYIHSMLGLATNFAKYGNPTPEGNSPIGITWIPSGVEGLQADLNLTSTMNPRLADASALSYEAGIGLSCI